MVCVCVFLFCFFICSWFPSVRCSPPWPLLPDPLVQTRPISTFITFFCTQEKLLPFPSVLKWCVLLPAVRSLSPPPPTRGGSDVTVASYSPSPTHHLATPPLLPLRILSAQPEILAVFPCLDEVPVIYRDNFHRSETESPPPTSFGSFPPQRELGGVRWCCSADGTARK